MRLKFLTVLDDGTEKYVDLHIEQTEIKGFFIPEPFDKHETICLFFCSDIITVQQSPELLHFLDKHIRKINAINTK